MHICVCDSTVAIGLDDYDIVGDAGDASRIGGVANAVRGVEATLAKDMFFPSTVVVRCSCRAHSAAQKA